MASSVLLGSKLSEILKCCFFVSRTSFFNCLKGPKIDFSLADRYLSYIATRAFVNTFYPKFVGNQGTLISAIFLVSTNTKIMPTVIQSIAIDMIDKLRFIQRSLKDSFHYDPTQMDPTSALKPIIPSRATAFLSSIVSAMNIKSVLFNQITVDFVNFNHGVSVELFSDLVKTQEV